MEEIKMSNVTIIPDLQTTDPMDVVRFTQLTRKRMFDKLTDNGLDVTGSFKEVSSLLRDMDITAVTTRKLDIEQQVIDTASQVQATHRALRNMLGGRDPFLAGPDSPLPIAERVEGQLPGQIPHFDVSFVPGEKFQGEDILVVSDFVSADE